MRIRILIGLLMLCALAQAEPVPEGEPRAPLIFELSYITDLLVNAVGGVERGSDLLGSILLDFKLDAEAAMGWKGASFEASVLGVHGGPFTDRVGDFQTVSNVEAPPTVSLFRLYYEQKFFEEQLSFLVGLYNVDSEFDTRDSAEVFVHSSPGTGGDLGQLGLNGPGIYPVGALGARVRYQNRGWYGQMAMVEGVPGDPDDPFGTTLRLDRDEGLFVIGEFGHVWSDEHGPLGKAAFGAWGFTTEFETHLDPDLGAGNRGAYLSLEKTFHREEDPEQGLAGFLRAGVASGRVNPIETYLGGGLVYTGLFEGRDQDRLGLAFNTGFAGKEYLRSGAYDGHETALELTYAFNLNDNLSLQPEVQYILNPGFDASLDNSLVLGLRAVATFSTN